MVWEVAGIPNQLAGTVSPSSRNRGSSSFMNGSDRAWSAVRISSIFSIKAPDAHRFNKGAIVKIRLSTSQKKCSKPHISTVGAPLSTAARHVLQTHDVIHRHIHRHCVLKKKIKCVERKPPQCAVLMAGLPPVYRSDPCWLEHLKQTRGRASMIRLNGNCMRRDKPHPFKKRSLQGALVFCFFF